MRFGLIGYGAWGKFHAQALRKIKEASLVAICCKNEATAASARQDFPEASIYRDYRELLDRRDIEAVDIVVPNALHVEIGVAALERGKDVLLEKPMATTVEGCDQLIAAARQNNRVLSIGHELRLSSQWGKIKHLIDTGDLGTPLYILLSLFRFPFRQGAESWRYQKELVGSWILEEPVHFFDFVLWFLENWGTPTSLLAYGNTKGREAGLYDNFTALVRFPEQIYAVITQTIGGFEYHQVMEVVGTEGSLRTWWAGAMDRTRQPQFGMKLQRRGQREPESIAFETLSGEVFELEEQLRLTVHAFRERRPLVSGEEARKCVVLCVEAERSLREGREIALQF